MSEIITPSPRPIPLALKVALTAFLCVQVPFYWSAYGPTNFLYFCDIALFLTVASVLTEKRLPASMAAVGILLPQLLWVIDFVGGLFGHPVVNLTDYMFQDSQPLYARAISLFHGWLPFVLLYVVYRLGYDRRALAAWTVLAWGLMLIAYFFLPVPQALPVSLVLTFIALVLVGIIKGKLASMNLAVSILEIVVIGVISAAGGYLLGTWVPHLFGY